MTKPDQEELKFVITSSCQASGSQRNGSHPVTTRMPAGETVTLVGVTAILIIIIDIAISIHYHRHDHDHPSPPSSVSRSSRSRSWPSDHGPQPTQNNNLLPYPTEALL